MRHPTIMSIETYADAVREQLRSRYQATDDVLRNPEIETVIVHAHMRGRDIPTTVSAIWRQIGMPC